MKTRTRAVPPPEDERPTPVLSEQVCQKCKAVFRWERAHLDKPGSPLVLRLKTPSDKCDCGYGWARPKKTSGGGRKT